MLPLTQVLHSLGALATSIVPLRLPVRPLEIDLEIPEPLSKAERAVLGGWVSEDGAIRLELRPNGRFGKRREAAAPYGGRYEVDSSRLYFESDAGQVWRGEFRRGRIDVGTRRFRRA